MATTSSTSSLATTTEDDTTVPSTTTQAPTTTTTAASTSLSSSTSDRTTADPGMSGGAIAAIVIVLLAVVLIAVLLTFYLLRRRRRKMNKSPPPELPAADVINDRIHLDDEEDPEYENPEIKHGGFYVNLQGGMQNGTPNPAFVGDEGEGEDYEVPMQPGVPQHSSPAASECEDYEVPMSSQSEQRQEEEEEEEVQDYEVPVVKQEEEVQVYEVPAKRPEEEVQNYDVPERTRPVTGLADESESFYFPMDAGKGASPDWAKSLPALPHGDPENPTGSLPPPCHPSSHGYVNEPGGSLYQNVSHPDPTGSLPTPRRTLRAPPSTQPPSTLPPSTLPPNPSPREARRPSPESVEADDGHSYENVPEKRKPKPKPKPKS